MDVVNHSSMALTSDFVVKNMYEVEHMKLFIQAVPDPGSST